MKQILLGVLIAPCMIFSMETEREVRASGSSASYELKEADWTLWRGIDDSNHNQVLSALHASANQNYLWPQSDSAHKRYADLTAVMFAVKRLREQNCNEYAWGLASAITWDLGKLAMKYATAQYAQRYPIITHAEPLWGSHTAGYLFGTQSNAQAVIETYNPAKRLLYDLLTKENTDLTIKRVVQRRGNPETVLTHLNDMLSSWNPLTRNDGRDLSYRLGQVQRMRSGLHSNDTSIMGMPRTVIASMGVEDELGLGGGGQIMRFGNANNVIPTRGRLYYAMNDE